MTQTNQPPTNPRRFTRYMTLETIGAVSDNTIVSLSAVPA
jgi:hypothetical protein